MIWAFARIQSSIPGVLLKELESRSRRSPLKLSELVASTWALAETRLASSAIWPSVAESLEHYPSNPRALSSLLRAHAVSMVRPPAALLKLDFRGTSPQSLANSLWALAKLQLNELTLTLDNVDDVLTWLNKTPSVFKPEEFSSCLWAIASMEDEVAVVAFFQRLQVSNFKCLEDHHLSQVAWAFASAGVRRPDVMTLLASEILRRQGLGLQALANISWAYATLGMFMHDDHTLAKHLLMLAERQLPKATARDVDSLLGLLWAHRDFTTVGHTKEYLTAITERLRQLGRDLDDCQGKKGKMGKAQKRQMRSQKSQILPQAEESTESTESMPRIVLQVPGVVAIFKPPFWEVDEAGGSTHDKALSGFSQGLGLGLDGLGGLDGVDGLDGFGPTHGFVSRLDAPSSGLLLQATSFEGLFSLQAQRELGELERDYVALCLGWVPGDGDISFRLRKVGRTSVVSNHGRPALSRVKVLAHLSHKGQQVSLVLVRIESGRMHQIRAHLAHMGFPVCGDTRYSRQERQQWQVEEGHEGHEGSEGSEGSEGCKGPKWPSGHCLHRYRLAFTDLTGQRHEVTEPLPRRLASFLEVLQEHRGGENIRPWLSHSPLQGWEAVHRSWVPCVPLRKGDTEAEEAAKLQSFKAV